MASDPLEDVLNLEEQFYHQGYQQGTADGTRAGQIEGRTLGLETGFKKFVESGRLYGKTVVWANRLQTVQTSQTSQTSRDQPSAAPPDQHLPALPANARLQKNVRALYALVEPGTLAIGNTDDAVSDFDERLKRAHGKARIVEKMVGESSTGAESVP